MTDSTEEQAREIAGKLDARQVQTILLARDVQGGLAKMLPVHRDMGRMRRSIEALGLCNEIGRLTKMGLAVRTILQEQGR